MRNAMWVGGGITGMGEIPVLGVKEKGIAKVIRDIFRNGEKGFFYDPSDLKTQYQDAAGTVPVTAVGQPVGLMLDKSKGLALGPEKVTNGNFAAGTQGWTLTGNTTVNTAGARLTGLSTASSIAQTLALEVGKTYMVTASVTTVSGGLAITVPSPAQFNGSLIFTATSTQTNLYFRCYGSSIPADVTLSNISVREFKGNHAYQTTSASRPILRDVPQQIDFDAVDDKLVTNLPTELKACTVLRAIPNVGTEVKYNQTLPLLYEDSTNHAGLVAIDRALTRQEQLRLMTELDKKAGATSLDTLTFKVFDNNQAGFVYDPNDLSTMFQDVNGMRRVTQVGQPVGLILDKSKPTGRELAVNGSFKDGTTGWTLSGTAKLTPQGVHITGLDGGGTLSQSVACEVGKTYLLTAKISVVNGGVTNSTGTAAQFFGSRIVTATLTSHSLNFRGFGNSTDTDFTITDISFCEISSNNAYQSASASRPILRQNDVTGANYLEFDGADDSLETGIVDFTSTDKVSLFAGVRKLSDKYSALCIELGEGLSSTSKAFALFAPSSNGSAKYDLRNVVTTSGANTLDIEYNAPHSAVLAGTVTPNEVTKATLRVNGKAVRSSDRENAGNFIAAPLYIGRRGGTSLPFTGHIYGLIGIGKLVSDSETVAIEKELAKRVGVTLNV